MSTVGVSVRVAWKKKSFNVVITPAVISANGECCQMSREQEVYGLTNLLCASCCILVDYIRLHSGGGELHVPLARHLTVSGPVKVYLRRAATLFT